MHALVTVEVQPIVVAFCNVCRFSTCCGYSSY